MKIVDKSVCSTFSTCILNFFLFSLASLLAWSLAFVLAPIRCRFSSFHREKRVRVLQYDYVCVYAWLEKPDAQNREKTNFMIKFNCRNKLLYLFIISTFSISVIWCVSRLQFRAWCLRERTKIQKCFFFSMFLCRCASHYCMALVPFSSLGSRCCFFPRFVHNILFSSPFIIIIITVILPFELVFRIGGKFTFSSRLFHILIGVIVSVTISLWP